MEQTDADLVVAGLEAAAERGDPAEAVYARLFALHPGTEALFVLGPAARGHMLDEVLTVVLDFIGPRNYAPHFMRSEVVNHENLGVEPDVFMGFFAIVRDELREQAGAEWTPPVDAAWMRLLAELDQVFGRAAVTA